MHRLDVRVYCGCRLPSEEHAITPAGLDFDECFNTLESLYWCDECRAIRCPLCVDKEPVTWYCPLCLFEVTPVDARRSNYRCSRNCLLCPWCSSNVIVRPVKENPSLFDLSCALCEWKDGSGCVYQRGTPLSLQIETPDKMRFDQLREAFSRETEINLGTKRGSLRDAETLPHGPRSNIVNKIEVESHQNIDPVVDNNAKGNSGPQKRSTDPPERVPLRVKWAKKCRACARYCIVPVPKVSAIKFTTKSVALAVIPRIDAFAVSTGDAVHILVTNPSQDHGLTVNLASLDPELAITRPNFDLGPLQVHDSWGPQFLVARETTASRQAFMARSDQSSGPNWVVIEALTAYPLRRRVLFMNVRYPTYEVGVWVLVIPSGLQA